MSALRLRIIGAFVLVVVAAALAFALFPVRDEPEVVLVAVLGALVVAWGLSSSLLASLSAITLAADKLASGDFSARAETTATGEIEQLTDSFNRMAARVEAQVASGAQEGSRLAAALNSSVDAVIAVGRDGRSLFANQAAEHLFGRDEHEIVGSPFAWTLPNERVLEAIRLSREEARPGMDLIERTGHRYLQVVTTPISGGGEWNVLVVFHDLTDVRRTEQMRRDFVANVSHELRTPLAAIKSVIETLVDGGALEDPPVARDFLGRADAEVDRLIQLVEELLELSRIETGDLPLMRQPTDIRMLLSDVVRRLAPQAERKHQMLELDGGDASPLVIDVDAVRLERAVTNLVHNAIKFTNEGGDIHVGARRDREQIVVSVSDNGAGIAPEDLPRIFERFYKVDQSRTSAGRGIGLAIVKHTVEAHGGTVRAESILGRGSTFSFTLPAG